MGLCCCIMLRLPLWLQVASLLSSAALSAVLGLVQKCCAAARSSKNTEEDAPGQEASGQNALQCTFVLRKLAVLLSSHGLAKQPDMLLPLMDTLGEAARSSCATGVHTPSDAAVHELRGQVQAQQNAEAVDVAIPFDRSKAVYDEASCRSQEAGAVQRTLQGRRSRPWRRSCSPCMARLRTTAHTFCGSSWPGCWACPRAPLTARTPITSVAQPPSEAGSLPSPRNAAGAAPATSETNKARYAMLQA